MATKSEEREKRIVQRIQEAERWRDANYKKAWDDNYRRFRGVPEGKREGSNLFVPYTAMITKTISARLSETVFAARPYVSVTPRDERATQNALSVQAYLDYLFAERMKISRVMSEEVILSMCIYGTAITYLSWSRETVRKKRREMVEEPYYNDNGSQVFGPDGLPITGAVEVVEEYTDTLYDDPVVQMIELQDFFVDPGARDLKTARYCGHKEYLTEEELKRRKELLGWEVDLEKVKKEAKDDAQRKRYSASGKSSGEEEDYYPVYHYWEGLKHAVLVGDRVVFEEENPYFHGGLPYNRSCYEYLPGEFFGVGIPESIAGSQDELNTLRNQGIDYNSMSLRRMWKVRKGCGLKKTDLVWRQNGILEVDNMDDVLEIDVQQLPASAFSREELIKRDMQEATGCFDIVMGLSAADETATTTMTKDNNASIRFKQVMSAIVEDLLIPIAQKCVSMEQQFMTGVHYIPARQDKEQLGDTIGVTAQEFTGEFDLNFAGTATEPTANKAQKLQNFTQFVSFVSSLPMYQQDPGQPALRKVLEALLRAMDIENPENYIPSAAPMNPAFAAPPAAPEVVQLE